MTKTDIGGIHIENIQLAKIIISESKSLQACIYVWIDSTVESNTV